MNIQLSQVISEIESGGNLFAVRYEPKFVPSVAHTHQMQRLSGSNYATAAKLCSMSWGQFQFMGTTLIDLGLGISPIQFAGIASTQVAFFNLYCHEKKIFYSVEELETNENARLHFGAKYNGPHGAADYSAKILSTIQKLKGN